MVHLFDMFRIPMRYLSNFCQFQTNELSVLIFLFQFEPVIRNLDGKRIKVFSIFFSWNVYSAIQG